MSQLSRRLLATLVAALFAIPAVSMAQEVSGPEGDNVYVRVTQNRELSGTPIELTEIKVTTSFGEVAIPIAKVDGIKMHADADDSAVIAFKNGDLVTGKVNLDVVKLKTDWGVAHVNTAQIEQITMTRGARFYPDSSTGSKGFRFSKTGGNTQSNPSQLQGIR
jgi:hypothetical protein